MKRKILQKLNWTEDKILKPKYGTANEVRAGQLIDLVLELDLIPIVAANLGISERTFKRMMVTNLPEIRLTGLRTWRYYFIDIIGYRDCKKCFVTKPREKSFITNLQELMEKLPTAKPAINYILNIDKKHSLTYIGRPMPNARL